MSDGAKGEPEGKNTRAVLVIAGTAATCEQVGGRARCASYEGPPTILNEGKAEDVSIKMFLISNNMYSIDSNLLHIKHLNFAVSAGRS
jgi:hypothetical protein